VRRVALAAAVLAAAVAGCGGGHGAGLQPPPGAHNPAGISATISPRVTRPGHDVELVIRNRTSELLEGGLAYGLDRWELGWRRVNADMAFILIVQVVNPRRDYRQRIDVPADAEAGIYRVVKEFRARGRHLTVDGRFNVQD
jgi:hypothetical protein